MTPSPITLLGDDSPCGSYILRIQTTEPLDLRFGRFRKGMLIHLPVGEYIYVGSAMARKGATSLARRLVRHATRTEPQAPHDIRPYLIETCLASGLGSGDLRLRRGKTRFWNVDHLLDEPTVHLTHIIAIRSTTRLEAQLGQHLERDPATHILVKGLGANDVPGNTHLLRLIADDAWWNRLAKIMNDEL